MNEMTMKEMPGVVTVLEVEQAFDTLLEVMARECDSGTYQTALFVKVDVMDILAGTWRDKAAEERAPAAVDGVDSVDARRCPACNQTLRDIGDSMFACPICFETFGDEAVEAALPF